jgi:hypothetical protein
MENWKRAVIAGSAGISAIMFLQGKRAAGVLLAGVSLAVLASEYPEKFAELRRSLPEYFDRGTAFLEMASRAGERMAEAARNRSSAWYGSLRS